MRFSFTIVLASLAALASSVNTVEFINQDGITRTIYFTQQAGFPSIGPATIAGLTTYTVEFPTGWIGNYYSVSEGAPIVPGMLGELRWNGWNGLNWFDVSAIVNPNDLNGVKTISPKYSGTPSSGCESYVDGCGNAYYTPGEDQTKSTAESALVCTLGTPGTPASASKPKGRRHPRHFIAGHSAH
jgi:hypothetical protein